MAQSRPFFNERNLKEKGDTRQTLLRSNCHHPCGSSLFAQETLPFHSRSKTDKTTSYPVDFRQTRLSDRLNWELKQGQRQ